MNYIHINYSTKSFLDNEQFKITYEDFDAFSQLYFKSIKLGNDQNGKVHSITFSLCTNVEETYVVGENTENVMGVGINSVITNITKEKNFDSIIIYYNNYEGKVRYIKFVKINTNL